MRPLTYRCPNPKCRTMLVIPESMRGQTVRCADCGHSFVVPILLRVEGRKPGNYRKAG